MIKLSKELVRDRTVEKIVDSAYSSDDNSIPVIVERRRASLRKARDECLSWINREIIPRITSIPTDNELSRLGEIIAERWPILTSGVNRVDLTQIRQVADHSIDNIIRVYALALVFEVDRVIRKSALLRQYSKTNK